MGGFPWQLFRVWLRREIKTRYAGSFAGILWAVIGPVFTILLFYVLFAFIFQVRVPEIAARGGYFYFLVGGLLPWLSISDGLSRAAGTLVGYEQFLQKQAFPVEILPLTSVIGALLPQLVGSVILLFLVLQAGIFSFQLLWLFPIALLAQILVTLGLGLALAILAVHFRDLLHALPLALQFFFYATPILYQLNMVPEEFHWLFMLNPFTSLILTYQAAFLGLPWTPGIALALVFWVIVLGLGGFLLFRVLKPTLGELA